MKQYKVYTLLNEELVFEFAGTRGKVNAFVTREEKKTDFIVVESYTYKIGRISEAVLVHTLVYLSGIPVERYYHKVTPKDIEKLKRTLTTIYRADGNRTYLPNLPLTTPEVMGITHGWFSMSVVKDEPERMALLYFDTKQYDIDERPPYNPQASRKFKRKLYGDVLYINELLVS